MNTTCGWVEASLNLLLFCNDDRVEANKIAIQGRRLEHLQKVHRANAGDTLRVGEIGGLTGEGKLLDITADRATVAVSLQHSPPEKLPLRLIVALPRPKMLRRILRTVAELGVAELHLINSYRVEKSYWQSPVLESGAIRELLLQGLEQSRDTILPLVHCHRRFKPFVEDTLPAMISGDRALLAHPGSALPCPRHVARQTTLIVGPEGGFIPYEVTSLSDAGCEVVSLGPRILRVENAINYLVGRLF